MERDWQKIRKLALTKGLCLRNNQSVYLILPKRT